MKLNDRNLVAYFLTDCIANDMPATRVPAGHEDYIVDFVVSLIDGHAVKLCCAVNLEDNFVMITTLTFARDVSIRFFRRQICIRLQTQTKRFM